MQAYSYVAIDFFKVEVVKGLVVSSGNSFKVHSFWVTMEVEAILNMNAKMEGGPTSIFNQISFTYLN